MQVFLIFNIVVHFYCQPYVKDRLDQLDTTLLVSLVFLTLVGMVRQPPIPAAFCANVQRPSPLTMPIPPSALLNQSNRNTFD